REHGPWPDRLEADEEGGHEERALALAVGAGRGRLCGGRRPRLLFDGRRAHVPLGSAGAPGRFWVRIHSTPSTRPRRSISSWPPKWWSAPETIVIFLGSAEEAARAGAALSESFSPWRKKTGIPAAEARASETAKTCSLGLKPNISRMRNSRLPIASGPITTTPRTLCPHPASPATQGAMSAPKENPARISGAPAGRPAAAARASA